MAIFRRRRRVNLGTYEPPEPRAPVPVEDMVDEGALIVASTVRMAVKNLIIVSALRDHVDFNEESMLSEVRSELHRLANEKREEAERIEHFGEQAQGRFGKARHQTDYHESDLESLELRKQVSVSLADRLDELSTDDGYTRDLVEQARERAFDEFASSVEQKLAGIPRTSDDPTYRRGRAERLRQLVNVDLVELERAQIPEY